MTAIPMLAGGFDDPVHGAQATFRAALQALSEPGTVVSLRTLPERIDGLDAGTYALCLTLLDGDTPVWIAPEIDTSPLRRSLRFHCGFPQVEDPARARFALLDGRNTHELERFDAGSDRDPDQSCTLLIQVSSLDEGLGLRMQGPGIESLRDVRLPLPAAFWQARERCNAFPRGLDFFFICGDRLLALPRSTRVTLIAS